MPNIALKAFLTAGALALIVGGFIAGDRLWRNAYVQSAVERLDPQDKTCREAGVAKGASCPEGCVARPARSPDELFRMPECRSPLWVKTCGEPCEPKQGLARLETGEFVESGTLYVTIEPGSFTKVESLIDVMNAHLENGISGLNRYKMIFPNEKDSLEYLRKVKERVEGIEEVLTADYVIK